MSWTLNWSDWLTLATFFGSLSLLSVGAGALTTSTQMYQFLVVQKGWLTASAFSTSIAIAQASPGPNVLFVSLFGLNVGMAQGDWVSGVVALLTATIGFLLPSSIFTVYGTRWVRKYQHLDWVRAFKIGVAPVSGGLLAAAGWMLLKPAADGHLDWHLWVLALGTMLLTWKTRFHLLLLFAIGAAIGALMSMSL